LFYQVIIFVLLTAAGFLICRQLLKIPKMSMKKNIRHLQNKKEKTGSRLLNRFVMPFVKPVSRLIPLDPVKEARMASTLRRGGLELTPKEYYARAIICAIFTLPLALLLFAIGAKNLVPIVLIFSIVVYFHFMTDLKDKMKEKKMRIEMELPGFVRSILYKLDDIKADSKKAVVQVDLIQIFEDYLKVASDVFYNDVSVLVMEMKAKDIETALRNFNERIGLAEVSFLVNALIGLHRGEHQGEALAYLARDMDIKAKEALKKKLNKLPRRIKIASIPLVAVTLASLLYVIGSHLIKSMGGLF
jgi:flagellar protein FlaJ